jgi:hypothetical protein
MLPERSQSWGICLDPLHSSASAGPGPPVSQVWGTDFEKVTVTTKYDTSSPSFAVPHSIRQKLDWTNEQRKWAEQGEVMEDIEGLRLQVSHPAERRLSLAQTEVQQLEMFYSHGCKEENAYIRIPMSALSG